MLCTQNLVHDHMDQPVVFLRVDLYSNLSTFQMLLPSAFKTSSSRIRPSPTSKMPKHIQMGTGFVATASNGGTTTSSLLDSGVGSNDSQGR